MGFCVKSELARFVRGQGLRASAGIYAAADKRMEQLMLEAVSRAKANGRTTLLPQDV